MSQSPAPAESQEPGNPIRPIDPGLLAILRCPHTGQVLSVALGKDVAAINSRIAAGTLVDASGEIVTAPLEAGLVCESGQWLYPIRDSIPTLIPEEAIPLSAITDPVTVQGS